MEQMNYKKYLVGNVFWSWNDTFEKLKYYIEHNFTLEKDLKEDYAKFFFYKKDIRKRLVEQIDDICDKNNKQ